MTKPGGQDWMQIFEEVKLFLQSQFEVGVSLNWNIQQPVEKVLQTWAPFSKTHQFVISFFV